MVFFILSRCIELKTCQIVGKSEFECIRGRDIKDESKD